MRKKNGWLRNCESSNVRTPASLATIMDVSASKMTSFSANVTGDRNHKLKKKKRNAEKKTLAVRTLLFSNRGCVLILEKRVLTIF